MSKSSKNSLIRNGALLALASSSLGIALSGALFTDTATVGGNGFSTGDVEISTDVASAIVTFEGMMAPGDSAQGAVVVTNSGTIELRYSLSSTATEDTLAAQLDLVVWDEAAEGEDANATCGATAPETTLYSGDLGSVAGTAIFGNTTTGADAGDRTLAANADETLCFDVSLPTNTDENFENLTTSATFSFAAEQTANNG